MKEVKELQLNGLIINNVHYKVELSALVCDTPAYHGCDKCEQHMVSMFGVSPFQKYLLFLEQIILLPE